MTVHSNTCSWKFCSSLTKRWGLSYVGTIFCVSYCSNRQTPSELFWMLNPVVIKQRSVCVFVKDYSCSLVILLLCLLATSELTFLTVFLLATQVIFLCCFLFHNISSQSVAVIPFINAQSTLQAETPNFPRPLSLPFSCNSCLFPF